MMRSSRDHSHAVTSALICAVMLTGVVTTHVNITAQINALVTAWEWSRDDRIILVLPLHHVHGIINVVSCALWSGATCEMLPRFDANAVWDRIGSGELTLFM